MLCSRLRNVLTGIRRENRSYEECVYRRQDSERVGRGRVKGYDVEWKVGERGWGRRQSL